VTHCRELTLKVNELERQIVRLVGQLAPTLMALPGCGGLSAAKIVGETAGVRRFRSKAAFARWNGTAPIPVWSGNDKQFRLNRGGNRQGNRALYLLAVGRMRWDPATRAYVARRTAEGRTKPEIIRCLKRYIARELYPVLLAATSILVRLDSSTAHSAAA